MPSRAVVWFRRDLRVADHPALLTALDAADQVVPTFVVDRTLLEGRPSGPNRRAFLHGALQALARDLEALGGRLLVREGDPVMLVPALAREIAAWDDPLPAPSRVPVAGGSGPGVPWSATPGGSVDGLWTAWSPAPGNRLRSPTGGPDAGAGGPGGARDGLGVVAGGFGVEGAVEIAPPDPGAALERLRWFVDRRVDRYARARNGDLPANNGGWQWVAGTGTDAAPFYRILNPVTQAEKFDPDGDYIRRWVPELAKLQPPAIFAPWRASPADLEAGAVRLGTDYPDPIVDHTSARNRALARHQEASPRRS